MQFLPPPPLAYGLYAREKTENCGPPLIPFSIKYSIKNNKTLTKHLDIEFKKTIKCDNSKFCLPACLLDHSCKAGHNAQQPFYALATNLLVECALCSSDESLPSVFCHSFCLYINGQLLLHGNHTKPLISVLTLSFKSILYIFTVDATKLFEAINGPYDGVATKLHFKTITTPP